jgi:hypothetical protein
MFGEPCTNKSCESIKCIKNFIKAYRLLIYFPYKSSLITQNSNSIIIKHNMELPALILFHLAAPANRLQQYCFSCCLKLSTIHKFSTALPMWVARELRAIFPFSILHVPLCVCTCTQAEMDGGVSGGREKFSVARDAAAAAPAHAPADWRVAYAVVVPPLQPASSCDPELVVGAHTTR